MTAPHHGVGSATTTGERDEALRLWLAEVQSRVASAGPQRGLRRRLTLPVRAARRFRSLVGEVGVSQAVVVATEYAGRRFGWRR